MQSENTFAALGLAEPLLRALNDAGYTTPTPIQTKGIPAVMAGGDLLAAAQTGTGKTASFALPILHRLMETAQRTRTGRPRALILTPTRELAAQVDESVRTYGQHLPLRSFAVYGGVSVFGQSKALRRPVDILVATPGRLLDHISQGNLSLSDIEILVLDEADRMLDMGFIRDIRKIMDKMPAKRQNLLFSATFNDDIRGLANSLLTNPVSVDVAPRNTTAERVDQSLMMVPQSNKRDLLIHLIQEQQWFQVLVFSRTKHGADRLSEQLTRAGIPTAALHGNKAQNARTRALDQFKRGKLQVLVATDIAARGIDVDSLPMVVNFELPNVPEDYVHRIGRTGRAGAEGTAVSLVCPDNEMKQLRAIERVINAPIERVVVAGFTVDETRNSRQRPPRDANAPSQRNGHRHGRANPDSQNARNADGKRAPHPQRAPRDAQGQGRDKPAGRSQGAQGRDARPRRFGNSD
ncbi:MAG: DEAD/DEAH box helicase [Zoogloeaceae bacterium]|uniref:DEAD/DEAH box helicase n=1 Tax=Denitromonas sp. TaxID=2734609 RepID=UPI002FDD3AFD|nr:DEAD/DEAH box helicase [Zoogloeaceae bacterium]